MRTGQRVICRIFFELLNRCQRLSNYLDAVGPGDTNEFVQLSRTIKNVLAEITATGLSAAKQASLAVTDESDEKTLLEAVGAVSSAFSVIHEFLGYFQSLPIRPETVLALQAAFGAEFNKHKPSVLLTTSFNAFEFDFFENLTSSLAAVQKVTAPRERNIVLQLPTVDVTSPLGWPLLAHEMGHAIDFQREISLKVAERLAPKTNLNVHRLVRDLCEEMSADLIATRAMGPAVPMSLASVVYCVLPQERVDWDPTPRLQGKKQRVYPATRWRLHVMQDYLAAHGAVPDQVGEEIEHFDESWLYFAGVKLGKTAANSVASQEKSVYEKLILPIAAELTRHIEDLPFMPFSFEGEDFERHHGRLSKFLPVGAQGQSRDQLAASVERYLEMKPPTKQAFEQLLRSFAERPTSVAAIFLSGFLYRNSRIDEESLKAEDLTTDSANKFSSSLDRIDSLLRVSVESSAVHRRLLREEEENKRVTESGPITQTPPTTTSTDVARARIEESLLSDIQIATRLVDVNDERIVFVSPLIAATTQIGPSSLDVRLGTDLYVTLTSSLSHIDLTASKEQLARQKRQYLQKQRLGSDGAFVLHPGQFVLASTLEYFKFPRDVAGRLEGRSSLGRLGLQVHATAGFVDPGFEGNLTFELINSGNLPIRVAPGFRLGQICFFPVGGVQVSYPERRYAKYDGSISVEPSRIESDPEIRL